MCKLGLRAAGVSDRAIGSARVENCPRALVCCASLAVARCRVAAACSVSPERPLLSRWGSLARKLGAPSSAAGASTLPIHGARTISQGVRGVGRPPATSGQTGTSSCPSAASSCTRAQGFERRRNGTPHPKGTRSQRFSCNSPNTRTRRAASLGGPKSSRAPRGTPGAGGSQESPGSQETRRPHFFMKPSISLRSPFPLVPSARLRGKAMGFPVQPGRSLGGKGRLSGDRQRGRSVVRARLLVALAAPTRPLSFARLLANSALLPSDETSSPPVFPKGYNGGRHKTAPERGAL